jgi:hypothetical protein
LLLSRSCRIAGAEGTEDFSNIARFRPSTWMRRWRAGYLCSIAIVHDNSNNIGLIAESKDGRATVREVGDNFYFRFPPCG